MIIKAVCNIKDENSGKYALQRKRKDGKWDIWAFKKDFSQNDALTFVKTWDAHISVGFSHEFTFYAASLSAYP